MGVYITEPDYERFKKYPKVIMIDCTHHKNKENRELWVATTKDRHNNMFAISRCSLPSSCNMVFIGYSLLSTNCIFLLALENV